MRHPVTQPVLLPLALDAPYDYLVSEGTRLGPGDFVRVPLGNTERLGVVWAGGLAEGRAKVDAAKLRPISERLDLPPLDATAMAFIEWVANYTLAPPGMVLRMMMSAREAFIPPPPSYGVRLVGPPPARVTPARTRVLELAGDGLAWTKKSLAAEAGVSSAVIQGLVKAGTLARVELPEPAIPVPDPAAGGHDLTEAQSAAAARLRERAATPDFSITLLDGVTGSGKTEVYFEAVAAAIAGGRQALVLLPEIALTSQFIDRFKSRFGVAPVEWHSNVSQRIRGRVWRAVAAGDIKAVVGARSALFLPFRDLGLIVVDEEHDPAFKQEDRVNYQARDMAVVRGAIGKIPIVLASATPSIESHVNVEQGRYAHVQLTQRFSGAALPTISAIDLRESPPPRGTWLSPTLAEEIETTLGRDQQALLFLNRRGYAPLTLCRRCGHRFECPQCAAWLVEHRFRRRLACHHCGHAVPLPDRCPSCEAEESLVPCGPGVERIAEEIRTRFPEARQAILSSDLIPNVAALRAVLERIADRDADIIIGTQLVAKGHHFPGLALVGVVDGDLGLGQADPRAAERTYQLLHQVTGRAGRAGTEGRGLIQTHRPDHPVIEALVSGDRDRFIAEEIAARRQAHYPPFGRLAALVVSAREAARAESFARALAPSGTGSLENNRARPCRGAAGCDRRPVSLSPSSQGATQHRSASLFAAVARKSAPAQRRCPFDGRRRPLQFSLTDGATRVGKD